VCLHHPLSTLSRCGKVCAGATHRKLTSRIAAKNRRLLGKEQDAGKSDRLSIFSFPSAGGVMVSNHALSPIPHRSLRVPLGMMGRRRDFVFSCRPLYTVWPKRGSGTEMDKIMITAGPALWQRQVNSCAEVPAMPTAFLRQSARVRLCWLWRLCASSTPRCAGHWRKHVVSKGQAINRALYELCLSECLIQAVDNSRLWVEDSREHISSRKWAEDAPACGRGGSLVTPPSGF
jgi:hypothetical protein